MKTSTNYFLIATTVVTLSALTTGCASGPDRVADDFGNSVRAMRQAQTMDPTTIDNPDMTPVSYTDGQRMENALKSYRENVGNPVKTERPITIDVSE